MRIRGLAFVAGLVMALAVPAAANAYQSATTGTVNVRSGAGVNHLRIATLPPGTPVWVQYCVKGWCLMTTNGLKGWVSARFLTGTGGVYRYQPPVVYVPPIIDFHIVVPRRHFHDFGYSYQHKPKRQFHKKKYDGGKQWSKRGGKKWSGKRTGSGKSWKGGGKKGGCPPWVCKR